MKSNFFNSRDRQDDNDGFHDNSFQKTDTADTSMYRNNDNNSNSQQNRGSQSGYSSDNYSQNRASDKEMQSTMDLMNDMTDSSTCGCGLPGDHSTHMHDESSHMNDHSSHMHDHSHMSDHSSRLQDNSSFSDDYNSKNYRDSDPYRQQSDDSIHADIIITETIDTVEVSIPVPDSILDEIDSNDRTAERSEYKDRNKNHGPNMC